MSKRFRKAKCTKCGKFFMYMNRMFKNKKAEGFVCIDCDEGEHGK